MISVLILNQSSLDQFFKIYIIFNKSLILIQFYNFFFQSWKGFGVIMARILLIQFKKIRIKTKEYYIWSLG